MADYVSHEDLTAAADRLNHGAITAEDYWALVERRAAHVVDAEVNRHTGKRKLRLRQLNQFWAWLAGYFWTDCPLCGRMFGGHEWRDGPNGEVSTVPHPDGTPGKGTAICPVCTAEGRGVPSWVSLAPPGRPRG